MSRVHPAGPRHADVLPEDHPAGPADDLNALDAHVWPRGATREDGVLTIGGVDVRDLAKEYGTPLYVYDEEDVRSRAREYAAAFHDGDVHYAGKAFLCTAVARWLHEEGLGLDVCSGGELAVALAAGFPTERITLHGSNKASWELDKALEVGVGRIVVDSFEEIARLGWLCHSRFSSSGRPRNRSSVVMYSIPIRRASGALRSKITHWCRSWRRWMQK
jgi:diaminopimelate decarboxylase